MNLGRTTFIANTLLVTFANTKLGVISLFSKKKEKIAHYVVEKIGMGILPVVYVESRLGNYFFEKIGLEVLPDAEKSLGKYPRCRENRLGSSPLCRENRLGFFFF